MPQSTINNVSDLEPSIIQYQVDQPPDLCLWDSNFASVPLLKTDEFLTGDTKNITCFLQRIAIFVKKRLLCDRTGNDIL